MPKSLLEMVREKRDAILQPSNDLIALAETEQRDLTPEEFDSIRAAAAQPDVADLDQRIATLTEIATRNAAAAAELPKIKVGNEERQYRPDGEHSFFVDLYQRDMRKGNSRAAEERLYRHEQQMIAEKRDVAVGAMAGAVPPVYLLDEFTPLARAGSPFLNSLPAQPLPPDGVSFYIPKVSTGADADFVAEGSGFYETDIVVGNDNPQVKLLGNFVDESRVLFERGGAVNDRVIFPDLIAAAAMAQNRSAVRGNGVGQQLLGIVNAGLATGNVVTYTDGTPTVAELWPKLSDAIQRINTNIFMPATAIYMTPARWGWITSAVDSQGRPLFNFTLTPPVTPFYGMGTALEYGQIVGTLQGLPVITDANIPTNLGAGTNEDVIIVVRTPALILWRDPLMRFEFEQAPPTAPGQVRLAVGGFILFHTQRYPKAISIITGTGLVTPTF